MKKYFKNLGIRRTLILSVGVLCVFGFTSTAQAAALTWSTDDYIKINDTSYLVVAGSEATSLEVGATTFTVTVPAASTFTLRSPERHLLTNSANLTETCISAYNSITVTGPVTALVITPNQASTCTPPSSGGGGGSSSSGGSSYTPPVVPPVVTPPAVVPPVVPPTVPEVSPVVESTTPVVDKGAQQLMTISSEAGSVFSMPAASVAETMGLVRNTSLEEKYSSTIVARFVPTSTTASVKNDIVNFVTYGTATSTILGAGERAGVVASFKVTFGKLPSTEADWVDVLKIANGRVPTIHNQAKEKTSAIAFKKIYGREANLKQAYDQNAINIMTYGLRVPNRNLNSEANALKSFKAIYGKIPTATSDWDILRAIAYSGAKK